MGTPLCAVGPLREQLRRAILLPLLGLTLAIALPAHAERPRGPEVVAYIFPDKRVLTAEDIQTGKLTRINYAFALIRNGRMVEGTATDGANLALLRQLRSRQPGLQLLISLGGWLGSGEFSDAVFTAESRRQLADSILAFVRRYDLDGIDIDWEYPGLPGADTHFRPEDGTNFNLLLGDLRARFDREQKHTGRHLLLTIAAGAFGDYVKHMDMRQSVAFLDAVNLMAYDFYDSGDPITGNHAALFPDPADPRHSSAAEAVQAFEDAGVPAARIVLGVPFYGHGWGNVGPSHHGLFQPGSRTQNLRASYPRIQNELLAEGFTRYWDLYASVPYLYNPSTRQFVSYEDPESLKRKCAFVKQVGLAGIMFWQYLSDSSGVLLDTVATCLRPSSGEARP